MIFIKKIVNQDEDKELAFQFAASSDFFHVDCNDTTAQKYTINFRFNTQSAALASKNGVIVKSQIHYNSGKAETRLTSEFKKFIFNECRIKPGDLIVLKRKETTKKDYEKIVEDVEFDVIPTNSSQYTFYSSILNTNAVNQQNFCCVTTEKETEFTDDSETPHNIPIQNDYNIIFYGAPGTGKSTAADRLQKEGNFTSFRTTFHPESDYFSFVGSYKPSTDDSGKITYRYVPQVFIKAYLYAWTHPAQKTCLNIEEINRGNCAQIFGDIFQLLDRKLPEGYSKYPIDVDSDCAAYIKNYFRAPSIDPNAFQYYKDELCRYAQLDVFSFEKILLPPNLYIIATMNTSDQSLYPMDSAFKRRWTWKYVPIDYKKVENVHIKISDSIYSWADFLRNINRRITEITQSEDKQLGQFFIPVDHGNISETEFRDKVLFYLWNDIYKDEFGTPSTIFKIKEEDGTEHQIPFSSLFQNDSSALLQGIMETVGLKRINDDVTAETIPLSGTDADSNDNTTLENL